MCKSICEAVIAIIILVFAIGFWQWAYTQWIIAIAAIVLLIHSFTCKKCFAHPMPEKAMRKR